jgi:hypothetical protein
MNQNQTESKPQDVEEPIDEGLDETTCYRLLDYERLLNAEEISRAILTLKGESVLIRNAFRWKKDGMVVSNAYECHGMEEVCEERGWKIVVKYGEHIAIISENKEDQERKSPASDGSEI